MVADRPSAIPQLALSRGSAARCTTETSPGGGVGRPARRGGSTGAPGWLPRGGEAMNQERAGRTLAIVLGVLVLAVVLLPALGMGLMGPRMMGPGMMWGYGQAGELPATGGWGWGLAMALGGLAML